MSHTAADEDLVRNLVELLKAALRLPAPDIRCTSVDGHRLPGGADIDTRIREEVGAAAVLLAVVTPRSLESIYVVFELGARWFSGGPFIPLLAPGVTEVPRPLDRFNGLLLGSRGGLTPQPEEYEYHLARVVGTRPANASGGAASEPDLPGGALDLLVVIRDAEDIDWESLVRLGRRTPQMTRFLLDALRDARVVDSTSGGIYYLSPKGRKLLHDRGLLE